MAIGTYLTGQADLNLAESWDGLNWSIVPIPSTASYINNLDKVACTSASACTAVGDQRTQGGFDQTLAAAWDGRAWSIVPTPNSSSAQANDLYDVSCPSSTACTAVGSFYNGSNNQPLVESWDGTRWVTAVTPPVGAVLYGVSCASVSKCNAVGYGRLTESWDGTSWSVDSPRPDSATVHGNLISVSCLETMACAAVGYQVSGSIYQTLVEQSGRPFVDGVSPTQLPVSIGTSTPTVNVTGSGFTGATKVHFVVGKKGFYISASQFTVNDAGTDITFPEPGPVGPELKQSFGVQPSYTLDVRVTVGTDESPVNAPADQVTFYPVWVDGVSPTQLPVSIGTSTPTVNVSGTGFTGATKVHFVVGTKGFYISASQFTVNDAGTDITFPEPGPVGPELKKSFGVQPSYTLDVRVTVGTDESPVNAPADQVTFYPVWVDGVSPTQLPINPGTSPPTVTVTGSGFTGLTKVEFLVGKKGFHISGPGITVNDAGTQITFPEPGPVGPELKKSFGVHPSYTLDVRVEVGTDESPVNAPADQVTFVR